MQASFGQDLTELPADELLVLTDDAFCFFTTSNLPFQELIEVLVSERLAGALLDRLTHHVHILEMNGESYLKQSKHKRNPQPGR
jgi:hypothetical protein